MLVVVAIIGLLAAYVGPRYYAQIGKSQRSVAKSQIEAFSRALGTYRLDMGGLPTTEEGLRVLVEKPGDASKWNGPYLEKGVPLDPWGHPYVYKAPGDHGDFDIVSFGADGKAGGTAEAAEITSW